MSDSPLSSLYVMLGLNVVDFSKGCDEAKKVAQSTANDVDKSFGSLTESRQGLMLAEEAIGVRLPRSLNTLLSKIPAVSAAFSAILPIAGVAVAIEIITKLIQKHEEAAEAIRKHAVEIENLTIKEADTTKSMELANLKLDDQIAKLSGEANINRLKETLIETGIEADRMAASFTADFDKVSKSMADAESFVGRFKRDMSDLWDLLNAGPETIGKAWDEVVRGDKRVAAGVAEVRKQQELVNAARKMPDTTIEEQIAKQEALGEAYKKLAAAATSLRDNTKNNEDLRSQMDTLATEAVNKAQQTANQISNINKRVNLDALENAKDAADKEEKIFLEQNKNYQKGVQDEEKAQEKARAEAIANLQEGERIKITATLQGSQARVDAIDAAIKEEQSKGLQDESFYRGLLVQRTDAVKTQSEEQKKAREAASKEEALLEIKTADEEFHNRQALQKAEFDSRRSDIRNSVSLGIMTEKEGLEQEKLIVSDELKAKLDAIAEETDAKLKAIAVELAAETAAASAYLAGGGSKEDPKYINYLTSINALQAQQNALVVKGANDSKVALTQTNAQMATLQANLTKLDTSWRTFFIRMGTETKNLGTQIKANLQANITHAVDAFSTGFAKMIVEGKDLGKAMKQLAIDIAESFISMIVKIGLEWLIAKIFESKTDQATALGEITNAAAVAGAQGTASWAGAPWPIDAGAPGFGAAMMTTAMGYAGMLAHADKGALIDAPITQGVPIMAHGKELVLPAHLSTGLQQLISGSGGAGRPTIVNMRVQTPDANSFRLSSGQTTSKLSREITRVAARNN